MVRINTYTESECFRHRRRRTWKKCMYSRGLLFALLPKIQTFVLSVTLETRGSSTLYSFNSANNPRSRIVSDIFFPRRYCEFYICNYVSVHEVVRAGQSSKKIQYDFVIFGSTDVTWFSRWIHSTVFVPHGMWLYYIVSVIADDAFALFHHHPHHYHHHHHHHHYYRDHHRV